MTNKIKGAILLVGVLIITIIGVYVWKYVHRTEREEYPSNKKIEELEWYGLGTKTSQDTCYVVNKDYEGRYETVPGKYIICYEVEGMQEILRGEKPVDIRGKAWLKKYNIFIYDIVQKKKIKSIDMLALRERYLLKYQFVIPDTGVPLLGKNGHIYLWHRIEDIPQKGSDKTEYNNAYLDIETNVIRMDDSGDEYPAFIQDDNFGSDYEGKPSRTWQKEYWEPFEQADWEAYDKANNFEELDFVCSLNSAAEGCVEVSVSTEVLPKKNDVLYSRFPEVEQWKGEKGKEAIFYIGGYPTVEEIQAMFVEQE